MNSVSLPEVTQIPEQELWRAVGARDQCYDGLFVFGVLSTRIYCSPSCPSRRPQRERIVFFAGPGEAEAAGFRACLRCKPRGRNATSLLKSMIEEACSFIENNPDRKITLDLLSNHLRVSPFHLQRVFKNTVGITPREYIEKSKLDRARLLLRRGESVRRSTYGSGHGSTSWLYSHPDGALGMPPAAYKNGGAGMRISYCITSCSLGRLLVGCTERGVCAVSLGYSEDKLESFLRAEYPRAEITKNAVQLSRWVGRIVEYVDSEAVVQLSSLPLDIRATSFQYRVWKELQSVPYGSTISYSEVARRMGSPKATRAVANACAKNPVALVIPCHRVIRNDGGLGGYRWGLERKRRLLRKESEVTASPN